MASRIVGALKGWGLKPTSPPTSANHGKVQVRRRLPKVRGRWCNKPWPRARGCIEYGLDRTGDAGLRSETRNSTLREGVQGVAASLYTTAEVLSHLGGGLVRRTGQ
jgi:hypothetical protein